MKPEFFRKYSDIIKKAEGVTLTESDTNNLNLDNYGGYYVLSVNGHYVDGPFNNSEIAQHKRKIHGGANTEFHIVELSDEEYRGRFCN